MPKGRSAARPGRRTLISIFVPGVPAQHLEGLVLLEPLGRLAVNLDHLVSSLQTGALGWRVGEWRHHGDPAVADIDLHAEPTVVAGGRLDQLLVVVPLDQ